MTTEQLAALKEVAEKAIETTGGPSLAKHVDALHAFRIKFDPVTCLALLEEVERLREVEANWNDAVKAGLIIDEND